MAASKGTRFGPYEIIAPIGAGGMGEVYRARDTRLGREVAVKILLPGFSENAERLTRFEQEACAAGSLNHPNILSIYDIGKHDGSPYVISELLAGETLRERLDGGSLPQKTAVDYALQIAHGLAAAHEKGIVHRDLKPENLFITKDRRVKILDFGLAKLTEPDGDRNQSEILTRRLDTDPGVIMGTVGYMSPEQVHGRVVDHRSDIFSFGAILYEMLAGRRAFHGESAAATMSAILREDPSDLSEADQHVSPALERLVNHCLAKNPEERFQSARDLAFALEALSGSTGSNQTMTVVEPLPTASMREWLPWSVAVAAVLLATLAFVLPYLRRIPAPDAQITSRFAIPLPDKARPYGPPVLSPDGRHIVYRLNTEDGKELLWVRPLGSLDARPLNGTDGAVQPFWSPDSRSIGFFSRGKLKKIDLSGGPAQTLCDAPSNFGGTWNRDGVIVFARGSADGIYRIQAAGGAPVRITRVSSSRKEIEHAWPYFLPDGRHFFYLARGAQAEYSAIYVRSLDSAEEPLRLLQAHSSVAYTPGYVLFVRENVLMAQGFDADRLELTGEPVPVAEQAVRNPMNGRAFFSVSENGVLALRTGDIATNQLVWFDRTGKQLGPVTSQGSYNAPALSPDGRLVAVTRVDWTSTSFSDIWLIDLARGAPTRFTADDAGDATPAWSPDGSRIAYISTRDGLTNLYQKLSSGAGSAEALLTPGEVRRSPDWSPDGRFILYSQANPGTNWDLMVLPLSGERKPEPFMQTNFTEIHGRFSPDGRWIAYASDETGQYEVYVQSFPTSGGKQVISTGGGSQPRWRGDGRELYYYTPDRKLMAVEVNPNAANFEVGIPRPLFGIHVGGAGIDMGFPGMGYYTPTRDGQRFLIAASLEVRERQEIIVILNWTADL